MIEPAIGSFGSPGSTSSMPAVVFRLEASRDVGLGHLRRCLVLAGELRTLACNCRFVCRTPLGSEIFPASASYEVRSIIVEPTPDDEQRRDAEATLRAIEADTPPGSWVVVDHYGLSAAWERRMRQAGYRLLAIDDYRHRVHHADLLVSDLEIPFDLALNERGRSGQILVGHRYALIAPEYAWEGSGAYRSGPKRLLVSYGGSDPTGETQKALEAIGTLVKSGGHDVIGAVNVVIGPFNDASGRIQGLAGSLPRVQLHFAPPGLAALIRAADLFLTAGGNSMVEALALRKPCLVTVTADNQAPMVEQLVESNLINNLGRSDEVSAAGIAEALSAILPNLEELVTRIVSRVRFDHLGARRIATAMLGSQSADAGAATGADAWAAG